MALNDFLTQSLARKPDARITLNGQQVYWKSFEVLNNNHSMADSFTLHLPLYEQLNNWTIDRFSKEQSIEVSISISVDRVTYIQIFLGLVDDLRPLDLMQDTVTISGRDYSSLLIDEPDTEKYTDFTSSDLAIKYANDVGLTPVVTATTTSIGVYFDSNHVSLTSKQSKWDLLTYLAQQEQFDVFVKNRELHFQPKVSETSTPYVLRWVYPTDTQNFHSANVLELTPWRSLTLARDIQVTVRSWNYGEGKSHTAVVTRSHKSYKDPKVQKYIYNVPNLSKQGAYDYALCQLDLLTQHEMGINATLVGDSILSVETLLKLEGTNSWFDTVYFVRSISRSMSFGGPFVMVVEAKNHATDSQVIS